MNPLAPTSEQSLQESIQTLALAIQDLAKEQTKFAANQQKIIDTQKQIFNFQKGIIKRQLGIHAPYFSIDWFDINILHLRKILADYVGKPDTRFLEIGSYEGRSTVWFMKAILTHPTARMHCVDPFAMALEDWEELAGYPEDLDDLHFLKIFMHNIKPYQEKVTVYVEKSQNVLQDFKTEHFDVIYVDGLHKASQVYTDTALAYPLLKVGGIMVFDDYEWYMYPKVEDNTKAGVDKYLAEQEGNYQVIHQGYQLAIVKIR